MNASPPLALLPFSRPRERLARFGPEGLTEPELWQCVLGVGYTQAPVVMLAQEVYRFTRLWLPSDPVPSVLPNTLREVQQARVRAVLELVRRWHVGSGQSMASPQDVLTWAESIRAGSVEKLLVLYCGVTGEVLRQEIVAVGGLNTTAVAPRDIFRPIVGLPVDSIVLCHNHPGGSLEPSPEDIVFTQRIEAACSVLGYWLRDHIIVTKREYYSFRAEGRLRKTGG